jgi:hypothetical protein
MVVDVQDLVAGLLPQPADPPQPAVGQVVEPAEPEVPQIGQDQRPRGEAIEQIAGGDLLVLARIGQVQHAAKQLGAQVEDGREFAGQQGVGALGHLPQRRQRARHLIEGGLVQGDDLAGERGQVARRPGDQARRQQAPNGGKHGLQGGGVGLGQALVDGLVGEGEARIVPETPGRQQPPDGALARHPPQHADEDAGPQGEGGQDAGAAGAGAARLRRGGFQVEQDGADNPLDLGEQRLLLLPVQRIGHAGGIDADIGQRDGGGLHGDLLVCLHAASGASPQPYPISWTR